MNKTDEILVRCALASSQLALKASRNQSLKPLQRQALRDLSRVFFMLASIEDEMEMKTTYYRRGRGKPVRNRVKRAPLLELKLTAYERADFWNFRSILPMEGSNIVGAQQSALGPNRDYWGRIHTESCLPPILLGPH